MIGMVVALATGIVARAAIGVFSGDAGASSGAEGNASGAGAKDIKTATFTRVKGKMRTVEIPGFPGLDKLSPEFHTEFVRMCRRLGVPPESMGTVIAMESGFRPDAANRQKDKKTGKMVLLAAGLPQFFISTAKALGTTVEQILGMSGLQQLPYIEKMWRGTIKTFPNRKWTVCEAYMANFHPVDLGKPRDFVIARKDDKDPYRAKVYEQNYGFDTAKRGFFTVGDVCAKAEAALAAAQKKPPIIVLVPVEDGGIT